MRSPRTVKVETPNAAEFLGLRFEFTGPCPVTLRHSKVLARRLGVAILQHHTEHHVGGCETRAARLPKEPLCLDSIARVVQQGHREVVLGNRLDHAGAIEAFVAQEGKGHALR